MDRLAITSCLARNTYAAGEEVAAYVSRRLKLPVDFVVDIPWQERERGLDDGRIHVGWICGLLYAWKADQSDAHLELLATPVMDGLRYAGRPVYFSELVVRRESPWQSFADLRGATWVYNEPRSFSGYHVVCDHLARLGESLNYFGQTIASGAHLRSLAMLLAGEADVTALDSIVLDDILRRQPDLNAAVRVVASLGPNPAPPWVISRRLPQALRDDLRNLLLDMHNRAAGRRVLAPNALVRFALVTDDDYHPIRRVARSSRRLLAATGKQETR